MPGLLEQLQGLLNRQTPRNPDGSPGTDNLVTDIANRDSTLASALLGDALGGRSRKPGRNKEGKIEYTHYRGGVPRASLGLLNRVGFGAVSGEWDKMPTTQGTYDHPYWPDRWDE